MQGRWIDGLVAAASLAAATATAQPAGWTAQELARVVALGPWPQAVARDTSNRASGRPDAIELGRRLFFDPRLSPVGYIACVTCHQPDRGWTDLKGRAHGLGDLDRHTPALNNLGLQRWYGWAGSSDSLWMASLRPILDSREMDSNPAQVRQVYQRVPEYACLYRRVFGADPVGGPEAAERVLVQSAKAVAAFVETLRTDRTPFDDLRDALSRGQPPAATGYPAAALRGLRLFVGKANCVACHDGPNLSDGQFHDTAVPDYVAQRRPDRGRVAGLEAWRASRYNLQGRHADGPGRGRTVQAPVDARAVDVPPRFRTPSLRNVAATPPYMHNGRLETLRDVLQHYAQLDPERLSESSRQRLRPLALARQETDDLLAFLATLTDARGADRGLPAGRQTVCDEPLTAGR